MIALIIAISLITALVVFLLATPLVIKIDTIAQEYNIRWKGIAKVSVVFDTDEIIFLRYRIFFLKAAIIP